MLTGLRIADARSRRRRPTPLNNRALKSCTHAADTEAMDQPAGAAEIALLWDAAARPGETALARAAAALLGNGLLICADLADPLAALAALLAARRRGIPVAVYPLLDDQREAIIGDLARQGIAEHLIAAPTTAINGQPLDAYAALAPDHRRRIYALLRSADLVVVSSLAALRRWESIVGRALARHWIVPMSVSEGAPRRGPIALDARGARAEQLAFAQGALAPLDETIVRIDQTSADPVASLRACAVVVAPAWHEAGIACADMSAGTVVVAPTPTGIDELGGYTYDPRSARSLRRAIAFAKTEGTPGGRRVSPAAPLARALPQACSGPTVSVIVRTYNRPTLLIEALESLAQQTYRTIEAVVVNDGGADVTDLLAKFTNRLAVTYVAREINGGVVSAANDGVRAARGTYIGYLDDDDRWYPDHAARLVEALERSGAVAAYGNALAVYSEATPNGPHVYDYAVYTDRDFDRRELLVRNVSTIHAIIHRRDAWERLDGFDERFPTCEDWDLWLRMSELGPFVHVDRMTVEYSWRYDPSAPNMTQTKHEAFAKGHEMLVTAHPQRFAAYPEAAAIQQHVAQNYRQTPTGGSPSRPVPPLPDW